MATGILLGTAQAQQPGEDDAAGWESTASALFYSERGGRIQDFSLAYHGRREFEDEEFLSLGFGVDVLTGASPNGATPAGVAQTFTRPSGAGSYTVAAGQLPLDDTFKDVRLAFSGNWSQTVSRLERVSLGGSFSREFDYLSFGGNTSYARDFNNRNTTLSTGLALFYDRISPEGGAPIPLATMEAPGDPQNKLDTDSKQILNLLLGLTQVLNRKAIVQLNYSWGQSRGYLNDPYKIVSVIDGGGLPTAYRFESRPDERTKQSLYILLKYTPGKDVVSLGYRYFWDDWGVRANTVDARYRFRLASENYIEPHARYYDQAAADFYRTNLPQSEPLPAFVSADFRLGEFHATTLGLKYGVLLGEDRELSFRLESYRQTGVASPGSGIGNQREQNLVPELEAVLVQAILFLPF